MSQDSYSSLNFQGNDLFDLDLFSQLDSNLVQTPLPNDSTPIAVSSDDEDQFNENLDKSGTNQSMESDMSNFWNSDPFYRQVTAASYPNGRSNYPNPIPNNSGYQDLIPSSSNYQHTLSNNHGLPNNQVATSSLPVNHGSSHFEHSIDQKTGIRNHGYSVDQNTGSRNHGYSVDQNTGSRNHGYSVDQSSESLSNTNASTVSKIHRQNDPSINILSDDEDPKPTSSKGKGPALIDLTVDDFAIGDESQKVQRRAIQNDIEIVGVSKKKDCVVDDDVEVVRTEYKVAQKIVLPNTVCIGMIQSLVFPQTHYRQNTDKTAQTESNWIYFTTVPGKGTDYNTYLYFHATTNLLGILEPRMSQILRNLGYPCALSVFVDMASRNSSSLPCLIMLSADQRDAFRIAQLLLYRYHTVLQPPTLNMPQPYYNPFEKNTMSLPLTMPLPIQPATGVRPDTTVPKTQIDLIYDSFTASTDLPEAEPDDRLITPFFKHQKQALYFMKIRETPIDYRDSNIKSMWEFVHGKFRNVLTNTMVSKAPNQVLGGIIAGKWI